MRTGYLNHVTSVADVLHVNRRWRYPRSKRPGKPHVTLGYTGSALLQRYFILRAISPAEAALGDDVRVARRGIEPLPEH